MPRPLHAATACCDVTSRVCWAAKLLAFAADQLLVVPWCRARTPGDRGAACASALCDSRLQTARDAAIQSTKAASRGLTLQGCLR